MTSKKLLFQEVSTVARYLERYAEELVCDVDTDDSSVSIIDVGSIDGFDSVIVIPIYDESEEQIQRFLDYQEQASEKQSVLMIWVFNAPQSSISCTSLERTQRVFKSLLAKTQANQLSDNLYLSKLQASQQILFIDRCQINLIPDKQGVGLARKLGMDLALKLIYQQYLKTQFWCSWIYSTDADVSLPKDYGLIPAKDNTTACIYPFRHVPERGYEKAMTEYEFSLHYYVESLKSAGSPYAFHTIGSLIVVSSLSYAQVRGIPKRAGAEDFYLLNKLAKLGSVVSLSSPQILISGRPSHRVPFGTGPALVKINSQHENNELFQVYHPRIFMLLRCVLSSVAEIEHSSADEDILLSLLSVKLSDSVECRVVLEVLQSLGWYKQVTHLRGLKTTQAIQQAFHVWFDAFITLRFIHELRDRLYPNIEITKLPMLLARERSETAIRGTEFDYTAWFKALGI